LYLARGEAEVVDEGVLRESETGRAADLRQALVVEANLGPGPGAEFQQEKGVDQLDGVDQAPTESGPRE
jgi:hypothetical protein